ncbi:endoribonuclease YbeY [Marinobacterium nitratireducens]|uniref:Endoribonuclease YbeY n=1 Tax=Marinobacterium nitratireducens TaxID=518897 RepID=A0A917ZC13_9GAMM|nr:rRNA maturation RNase YbeY [Marinobacterium nitratireducens]GGO78707.1 endoribonuclease YbeY [Marinobacterium nitratireducens]
MSADIELQIGTDRPGLPSQAQLQQWVDAALDGRRDGGEICIRIVDADESRALNHQYRGKDRPTNVLSFPFEVPESVPLDLLGDLVICAEVVADEAVEQHKPEPHHWAHMVIHGTLHLLGYDHINDEDAEEMESLERRILESLSIPDPYQER